MTPHDKYIWFTRTGMEQYFDLDADPREEHDLIDAPERAARIAVLRACLIEELAGREEGYVRDGELVAGRAPAVMLERPRPSRLQR